MAKWTLSIWVPFAMLALESLQGQLFLVSDPANTNSNAAATLVDLEWYPSPSSGVLGYFICYGFFPGQGTNRLDVGQTTTATLGGLTANTTYYFSVLAYGTSGQESPPSDEIEYTLPPLPPAIPPPQLAFSWRKAKKGADLSLAFQGQPGASYAFQESTDLQNWTIIGTTNCASDSLIVFRRHDIAVYPRRFYRVLQQ